MFQVIQFKIVSEAPLFLLTTTLTTSQYYCYYEGMDKQTMLKAFKALDKQLKKPAEILIGGGAAMVLAHSVPLSTMDIDGLLFHTEVTNAELDPLVKGVAKELKLHPQWFNSYFGTFTYTIPPDYEDRLVTVYSGNRLKVKALGMEDLLIMKCFSGREKDIGHVRALAKNISDLDVVEEHIQKLCNKGVPKAEEALDFLGEIRDQIGR